MARAPSAMPPGTGTSAGAIAGTTTLTRTTTRSDQRRRSGSRWRKCTTSASLTSGFVGDAEVQGQTPAHLKLPPCVTEEKAHRWQRVYKRSKPIAITQRPKVGLLLSNDCRKWTREPSASRCVAAGAGRGEAPMARLSLAWLCAWLVGAAAGVQSPT